MFTEEIFNKPLHYCFKIKLPGAPSPCSRSRRRARCRVASLSWWRWPDVTRLSPVCNDHHVISIFSMWSIKLVRYSARAARHEARCPRHDQDIRDGSDINIAISIEHWLIYGRQTDGSRVKSSSVVIAIVLTSVTIIIRTHLDIWALVTTGRLVIMAPGPAEAGLEVTEAIFLLDTGEEGAEPAEEEE